MAKYMLLVGGADLDKRSANGTLAPVMLERYMSWVDSMVQAEQLVHSYKLFDQTGARLSIRGGQVTEGPFVESKEVVGGLFVIEAASLEQATEIARRCPVFDLQNGYVEVRAVERG